MKPKATLLLALAVGGLGATGIAQIEALTLEQMVARADNAVYAEIIGRKHFSVEDPKNGVLYYTALTLRGETLHDGNEIVVDVHYAGSFNPDTGEGVWNSEAPQPDDVRIGNKVVAFYGWSKKMRAGLGGNRLYAAHGGLYRTVGSGDETVVLGRGQNYAVSSNVQLSTLREKVAALRSAAER